MLKMRYEAIKHAWEIYIEEDGQQLSYVISMPLGMSYTHLSSLEFKVALGQWMNRLEHYWVQAIRLDYAERAWSKMRSHMQALVSESQDFGLVRFSEACQALEGILKVSEVEHSKVEPVCQIWETELALLTQAYVELDQVTKY